MVWIDLLMDLPTATLINKVPPPTQQQPMTELDPPTELLQMETPLNQAPPPTQCQTLTQLIILLEMSHQVPVRKSNLGTEGHPYKIGWKLRAGVRGFCSIV